MFKILFVCSYNTCRSPMAQYIMRHLCDLSSVSAIKVNSAGVYAKNGMPMSDNAKKALKELNIKPRFKSKEITRELVDENDLIIALTSQVKIEVVTRFNCLEKTRTFAEFGGENVPDPYGLDFKAYRKSAGIIFNDCVKLIQNLIKNKDIKLKRKAIKN